MRNRFLIAKKIIGKTIVWLHSEINKPNATNVLSRSGVCISISHDCSANLVLIFSLKQSIKLFNRELSNIFVYIMVAAKALLMTNFWLGTLVCNFGLFGVNQIYFKLKTSGGKIINQSINNQSINQKFV